MKVAIMGIRGIPANYGGFETFAEQLSTRLAKQGHDVTVYCRSAYYDKQLNGKYKNVNLVVLPAIRNKYLDTVSHTFLSVLHSIGRKFEVILICNSINSSFSFIPRLFGSRVIINVDGLEWQRAKWNKLGKLTYRISEWLATMFATGIVTDARKIQNYYQKKFKKVTTFIPYGAFTNHVESNGALHKYDLQSRNYILYVSRFEPENNPLLVVKAFEKTNVNMKLVMVGDAPFSYDYIRELKSTKDPRIVFTGYVFGRHYKELQSNAYAYIQATEVGGTHPALLEGMGYANCVLANDVPEHREVLGDAGLYFKKSASDLANKIERLVSMKEEDIEQYRKMAQKIITTRYRWESITNDYAALFRKVIHY